jgi:S1-C subfamily serine protease
MKSYLSILFFIATSTILQSAPIPKLITPDPINQAHISGMHVMSVLQANGAIELSSTIQPNSIAEKFGLKTNDVVKKINSISVSHYTEFYQEIAFYRPGAIITIEVERNTKKLTFQVKLEEAPKTLELQAEPIEPIIEP